MKSRHLLFLAVLFFCSCKPYDKIEFIVEPLSNSDLSTLHNELLERFKTTEFHNAIVEVDKAKNQIKVTADLDQSSKNGLARARAHFGSIKLDIWHAYDLTDKEIVSILDSLPQISNFKYNDGNYYAQIIGVCTNKEDLDPIQNQLREMVAKIENIDFLWGQRSESYFGTDEEIFYLYMINKGGKKRSDLSENNVVASNLISTSDSDIPEISIAFDKDGAETFAKMTETAYHWGGKAIAIVIDDKVFSAPRVLNGPIYGGRCSLSGDMTIEDANDICNKLAFGSLGTPLKLVSERIIKTE